MKIAGIKTYVAGRIRKLRARMRDNKLDAIIIIDPADVSYLTGFSGDDSVLLISQHRKVLVTDSRYVIQAREECPGLAMKVRKGGMSAVVGEVMESWGLAASGTSRKKLPIIGIDPNTITAAALKAYRKAVGRGLRLNSGLVGELRQCKDDFEVEQIRKAVRIAETALKETLKSIKPGVTELEVAAELEYEMARRGGRPAAFESIVAFGAHGAQPHARPGRGRLGKNQSILIDWGATVGGYRSDLTRCFSVGKILPAFVDVYQWVLEAQLAAIEEVRPGVEFVQVDRAARDVLERRLKSTKLRPIRGLDWKKAVYEHGTGHGLGLNIHEAPTLSKQSKGVLKEGMVVTIEPGFYIPGRFGIRIEDDVLVTRKGRTLLSRLGKDLNTVTLYM